VRQSAREISIRRFCDLRKSPVSRSPGGRRSVGAAKRCRARKTRLQGRGRLATSILARQGSV